MRVAFLCSTQPQAEMFLRVVNELGRLNKHECLWMTIDDFLAWSVAPFLDSRGVEHVPLRSSVGPRSFVELSLHQMWWSLFRDICPQVKRVLSERGADVVVVGNDRGLIEKQVIRIAKDLQAKTVLLQDGLLWRHEVRSYAAKHAHRRGLRRALRDWSKSSFGWLMRVIGRIDLAPTYIGQGGCDLICVMGEATREVLQSRGVNPMRIVVTGQPRYDGTQLSTEQVTSLRASLGIPSDSIVVTYFGVTADADARSYNATNSPEFASRVVRFVAARAEANTWVILKPHPREEATAYELIARDADSVVMTRDANSLDLIQISDAVISFVCTTMAEAALFGQGPLVLRSGFDGSVSESLGVSRGTFAEFADSRELLAYLGDLLAGDVKTRSIDAAATDAMIFRPAEGAAARIAAAMTGLVRGT